MDKWNKFRVKKEKLIHDYIILKKRQHFAQTFIVITKINQILQVLGKNYDKWEEIYLLRCQTIFVVLKISWKFKGKLRNRGGALRQNKNHIRNAITLRANATIQNKKEESLFILKDLLMSHSGHVEMRSRFKIF